MRTRLRPGEEVVLLVRRHWIALAGPLGTAIFLAGCLVAGAFIKRPYVVPAAGAALLASGLWGLWRWLLWHADLWAVTPQRVIDESGVLAVRIVDSPLETIHNITLVQTFMGRIMGYGTLNIQTAAVHGSTTIADVSRPEDLRDAILEMKERARGRAAGAGMAAAAGGGGMATAAPVGATAADAAAGAAGTKECPYCAETIKAKATVCRFCGRSL